MHVPSKSRPFRFALVATCAALLITATPIVAQQVNGAAPAEATAGVRLPSWPGSADHVARIFAAMQSVMSTTPPAALPAANAGVPVDASTLPGPRVRPDIRGVEPRLADDRSSAMPPPPRSNTIVISTLALVLIAVIITILVVK
jgi:hypothetical protein